VSLCPCMTGVASKKRAWGDLHHWVILSLQCNKTIKWNEVNMIQVSLCPRMMWISEFDLGVAVPSYDVSQCFFKWVPISINRMTISIQGSDNRSFFLFGCGFRHKKSLMWVHPMKPAGGALHHWGTVSSQSNKIMKWKLIQVSVLFSGRFQPNPPI
jgi:hypothetical protein